MTGSRFSQATGPISAILLRLHRQGARSGLSISYAACQKCFAGPTLYGVARSHVLHSDLRENVGSMFSLISRDRPPEAYIS